MPEYVIRFDRIQSGEIGLNVARVGEGMPVILLHGFPQNWITWRHQMPALVNAGFSAWAPELRGYGRSDRPERRQAYHLRHLVADVAAVVRATGQPRAHIVGHDWGGIIAWSFAGQYPELLRTLTILNAPHMKLYRRETLRLRQLFKSWYVALFQLSWLPERILSFNDFTVMRGMFSSFARPGTFSEEEVEAYVLPFRKPGALTAALNYYRANLRHGAMQIANDAVSNVPTQVIWGERDPALSIHLLDGLDEVAANVNVKRLPNSGHWVLNESPDEVNEALVGFLSHHQATASEKGAPSVEAE